MTPGARVAAAIAILDDWIAGGAPLDRMLAAWGRANRYAGSGDRRAIGDLVHSALRRRRSAAWMAGADDEADGRALMHGLLLQSGEPGAFFTGHSHSPPPLTDAEIARRRSLDDAPRAVRLDYPDWLGPEFERLPDHEIDLLRDRAPVHLRVNRLFTTRETAQEMLAAAEIETVASPLSETALTVTDGQRKIAQSRPYLEGIVEIQDAASQAAIDMAGAKPGQRVLDLCAGAGGKTLALAAAMENSGTLLAHDIAPERLRELHVRAERAGAKVTTVATRELFQQEGSFDLVVVDAPCSGSGAWRRNPDAKWLLTPKRLDELKETQDLLLDQAARLVAGSGTVLYATCSLFGCENDDRVAALLDRQPQLRLQAMRAFMPSEGGDGFFAARIAHAEP